MGIGVRDTGRASGRCWLLACALLVAAVLFHDFAMTTDVHVADAGGTSHDAQERHANHTSAPAHAGGNRVAATQVPFDSSCDAESCRPTNDCRVGLSGVLAPGGSRVSIALDMPLEGAVTVTAVPPDRPDVAPEAAPPLPPGVRRALLQVFLI